MITTSTKRRLFAASCVALTTTSMTFAIRARLETIFMNSYDLSSEQMGYAFGPAFWGFTLAMVVGGPLVDHFGIKKILSLAFAGHLAGITVTLLARDFWTLFWGTTFIGLGNGMIEAACNPLIATLYPGEKTKMLNRFHISFPAGIVVGSLLGFLLLDVLDVHWTILVGILFIPLGVYTVLMFGQKFPPTERVSLGFSKSEMLKSCVSPLFIFMLICMLLTAATELGTGQRISSLLETSGASPLLILAFINGLMSIGRWYAGDIVHRIKIPTLLLFSAAFSCIGLTLLSYSSGPTVFISAAVFALGICYFWPTMLSFVAEKIPQSGALGLSLMGGAGMLSVSIVLPIMGVFMDADMSGSETLRWMSALPAILMIAFAILHLRSHKEAAFQKTKA